MSPYIIATFVFLLRSVNVKATGTSVGLNQKNTTISCDPIIENAIEFHIYTRANPEIPFVLNSNSSMSLWNKLLSKNHPTIIFIHGFAETAADVTPKTIVNAHLSHKDVNIILVEWGKLVRNPWYYVAADNSKKVGPCVAKYVDLLDKAKIIDLTKLHVVGFSLGAHACGFMGKALAPRKVYRITGLDPAGPAFENVLPTERLDKSDATFVDIIHTDIKRLGIRQPIGHVDFYPNFGTDQPGCKLQELGCSHSRARLYYIESIGQPTAFPSKKCREWSPRVRHCEPYPQNYMGLHTERNARGIFLLETNPRTPFGRYMDDFRHLNIQETAC